jgi:hypothetical protein
MDSEQPLTNHEGLDVTEARGGGAGRPFLSVLFRCANSYLRVYRSTDGTQYLARCPKCGKDVRFQVGESGTSQRVFEVSCR